MKKYLNHFIFLATGGVGFLILYLDYNGSLQMKDFHWYGKIGMVLFCLALSYPAGLMLAAIWFWVMAVYCQIFGHQWRLFNPNPKYPTEKCRRCRKVRPVGVHLNH